MATCSDGDPFYLNVLGYSWDGLSTFDGCYMDIGETLFGLPRFYPDGEKVTGPSVYATDNYGSTEVWVLAYYDDSSLYIRCKDYFENDASLIHPTEVTRWDCEDDDGDYTREDVVETECGCPSTSSLDTTPSPTTPETTPAPLAPTLAPYVAVPSACGATESFRITSGGLPEVEGCFEATDESFSNPGATFEIWSVSGNTQFNQVVILGVADDGTGEVSYFNYFLAYVAEDENESISYCRSNEDAILVHPVDATWTCDISGTGSFVAVTDADISFECGCTTPAPLVVEPPSPAPTSSSVPLGAVIGGVVGGVSLLTIAGVFVAKRRRGNQKNGISERPAPGAAKHFPAISDGGGQNYPVVSVAPPPTAAYSGGPPPPVNIAPESGGLPPPPPYSEPPPAYTG